ncbi:hypothetical protein CHS0354_042999 [Potamilus streckersoni]|uniref:Fibronectin type-III domain-containing protein n=1 Tax=Potamilus streckersoni TaxID=2493646 RepID=A0AAE0W7D8_9BIVA|nr:hypothetical protein CHS0354_042999 [Potamilus streckersoni]
MISLFLQQRELNLEHSGPINIRVTENNAKGVRLEWDLPETESCYGRTDIIIILYMQDGSTKVYTVNRHTRFIDITGLDPSRNYRVAFSLGYEGHRFGDLPFNFRTAEEDKSAVIGAIVGGVVAAVIILGLVMALVVLIRRGKLEPVRERLRPLTMRIRKTIRGRRNNTYGKSVADELYIYGGMTFDEHQSWQINRSDVTLESLIKSAHFADIYKAILNYGTSRQTNVVAKCLKEGFSKNDKEMMMAKINFTGTKVGNHPNVLRFVGAVTDNEPCKLSSSGRT